MKKRYVYSSERELEGLRWTARVVDFGVGLTITAALNELYTAHMMLRERKDIYRLELKRLANEAMRIASLRRGRIFSLMRNRGFFDTYSDKVIDLAEQDITLFRISIKQTLDDHRYQDAGLISYIETARTLLDMAVAQFVSTMDAAREDYMADYSKAFCEFNVSDVLNAWTRVCNLLYATKSDINLNTERSLRIFNTMAGKFADGEYVQACLQEAAEAYPDFTNSIILKR